MLANMHEAKTHLSQLIERSLAGEEVIIARAGKPVVRLVPIPESPQRKSGLWRDQVWESPEAWTPDLQDYVPPPFPGEVGGEASTR